MKITLRRRHAHIVRDGALSHNIDHLLYLLQILNLERHLNFIIGSSYGDLARICQVESKDYSTL